MDIDERIKRLERQGCLYRNLFLLAGLLVVAAITYGATKPIPNVIRATMFEVLNADREVVVRIVNDNSDQGAIWVFNGDGKAIFWLRATAAGNGRLEVFNNKTYRKKELFP